MITLSGTHTRYDSSGRGIGPSQGSLPGIRTGNLSGVLMEPIWDDGERLIPNAALLFGYITVVVVTINTLKTKLRLLHLKPKLVPRSKHFPSRL